MLTGSFLLPCLLCVHIINIHKNKNFGITYRYIAIFCYLTQTILSITSQFYPLFVTFVASRYSSVYSDTLPYFVKSRLH